MSSWLAAWPASLFSRMERGVVGGDVSQRIVALSSWVACGTKPRLEAHFGCYGEQAEDELQQFSVSFCALTHENGHLLLL